MRATAPTLALLLLAAGCSSKSSGSAAPEDDAGIADAAPDVQPDAGDPFAVPDSSSQTSPDAALSKCGELAAQVGSYAATAAACTPNSNSAQCTATAQGICCPITVSANIGSDEAVNNLTAAVNAWKTAGCTQDCSKIPCAPAPSRKCISTGTGTGVCQ
jgi:hypothetical protein